MSKDLLAKEFSQSSVHIFFKRSANQSLIDFVVCDIMLFAIILHVNGLNCILCNMHARCFLLDK